MNRTVYLTLKHVTAGTGITPTQALTIRKYSLIRYTAFYLLHDYQRLTTYQIAEQFGCSQGMVSVGIHKCLDKMDFDVEFKRKISSLVKNPSIFSNKKSTQKTTFIRLSDKL